MTPMKFAAVAVWLLATLASAGTPAGAAASSASDHSLRVNVSPRFGRAPAIVNIQAFVERGAENRGLEFVLDSITYYRSSTVELNGADAPLVHRVEFRSVPVGTHDLHVILTGRSGVRAIVHDRVAILE
jgi:hypothetical protein